MKKSQDIKFQIKGLEDVQRMLKTLPEAVNDRVMYDLHKQAALIVKKEIELAVPESNSTKKSADTIRNNVIIRRQKASRTGVLIGFTKKVWYFNLIEKGTKVRETKGKGKYKKRAKRGRINRRPFLAAAHERAFPKAVESVTKRYVRIVNNSIKRQLRKLKVSIK